MINQPILLETDLWEAWIEFDPIQPGGFGTLYVIGEVMVDKSDHPSIIKCGAQYAHELALYVKTKNSINQSKAAEVVFSEPIETPGQYSSIVIYKDEKIISIIRDIEVVV